MLHEVHAESVLKRLSVRVHRSPMALAKHATLATLRYASVPFRLIAAGSSFLIDEVFT